MRRLRAVPSLIRGALRPTSPQCYRHCEKPVRAEPLRTSLPGWWQVYACPSGVVSVTSYAHWSVANPTPDVRSFLRRHTIPKSLVIDHDLRVATRHGPELGHAAERLLARSRPPTNVRMVYWRVYPFRDRSGTEQRLFVCLRHGRSRPVFFPFRATASRGDCPVCAGGISRRDPRLG